MMLMQVDSLIQLIGSGNKSTVEEEWLKLVESDGLCAVDFCRYAPVLGELVKKGDVRQAETLAETALDELSGRYSPHETVAVASAMLQAVKDSEALRKKTAEWYRKAYEGAEGLEALIGIAGLEGGRPVRRALRTLEVCLSISPGGFVLDRHEPRAARVESVDRTDWTVGYTFGQGVKTLGAVEFADNFEPVHAEHFRVLEQFRRQDLVARLDERPEAVLEDLCRSEGGSVDSTRLEEMLVPRVLTSAAYKKWWTKARGAVRSDPRFRIEGRSPVVVSFEDKVASLEQGLLRQFESQRDSTAQWELVEQYLKDCKQRGKEPDQKLLGEFYSRFRASACKHLESGARVGLREALLARRCAALLKDSPEEDIAVQALRDAADLNAMLAGISDERLLREAFSCVRLAQPEGWKEVFFSRLLHVPAGVCDELATALVETGAGVDQFKPYVEKILAESADYHEELLWLYDGPTKESRIHAVPLVTLLTRVLGVLSDLRRDGVIGKDESNRIITRTRSVIALRRYERFNKAIQDLGAGMAQALRTQLKRLDSLGRVVQGDLLDELNRRYPVVDRTPEVPPWKREDVIFVTAQGMSKHQSELEHHVNVKMKENARAIGAAAEHGDLSENSEYKFALEERDLLRAQLARMNEEMNKARVIDPAQVPTSFIGIGSRVRVESADGRKVELTFVGPWDADLASHRYNYLAPFAQSLMGKRLGESVRLDLADLSGDFVIAAIENGLE